MALRQDKKMSSTRLISKNLSRAPLAFFNLMTIFRPFSFNEFLLDFNVEKAFLDTNLKGSLIIEF